MKSLLACLLAIASAAQTIAPPYPFAYPVHTAGAEPPLAALLSRLRPLYQQGKDALSGQDGDDATYPA